MNSAVLAILLFLCAALVALVVVWYYARSVKKDLDAPAGYAAATAEIRLPGDRILELQALTAEPILLKQSEEGVRVQIDDRPMVPLAVFLGKEVSAALGEAAVEVTQVFGPSWVVLVSPRDDGRVQVQRLA